MRQFLLNEPLETSSVATEDVNHLVRAGVPYCRCGFPAAETKTSAEAVTQRLVLQVQKKLDNYRYSSCSETEN